MPNINSGLLDGVRRLGGRFRDLTIDGGLAGAPLGLRLRGATMSGHPTTGTWKAGDLVADRTGIIWLCTGGGTGAAATWVSAGLQLCTLAGDIASTGPVPSAGGVGQPADAGHVHYSSGMYLCAPTVYAPGTPVTESVTGNTMAAFSSANINTGSFTAPPSGDVVVTANFVGDVGTGSTGFSVGLAAHGTTSPLLGNVISFSENVAGTPRLYTAVIVVTGLTPGTAYTLDLMGASSVNSDTINILAAGGTSTTARTSANGPVTMIVQGV